MAVANRESLREMQTRLASRLQLAKSAGTKLAWLAVTAGSGNYLLPLRQSGEIVPVAGFNPVPRTQAWFLGALNIRGNLFGAVDLGLFLAHSNPGNSAVSTTECRTKDAHVRVVTLSPLLKVNCALKVASLTGLHSVESFRSSAPPDVDMPPYFGMQLLDLDGRRWQEVDLQILSQSPRFLNISA